MNAMKKIMALLLVFALAVSYISLGAVTAFAAEIDEGEMSLADVTEPTVPEEAVTTQLPEETVEALTEETGLVAETAIEETAENPSEIMMFSASPASDDGGSSGSETGDGGDGSGNAAGAGSNYMIAAGVTMQVVYYRYRPKQRGHER